MAEFHPNKVKKRKSYLIMGFVFILLQAIQAPAQSYDYDLLHSLMSEKGLSTIDLGYDPDADGLLTHFELALGTDPASWSPTRLTIGDSLIYRSIEDPALIGVSITLWQTADLLTWLPYTGTPVWSDGWMTAAFSADNFYLLVLNRIENRAPIVNQGAVELLEDTPQTITVQCSDPDGDALTYAVINAVDIDYSLTGDQLTLTPALNYFGPASISMTVSDGKATVPFDIDITVVPVNEPPTYAGTYGGVITTTLVPINGFNDPDSTLTFALTLPDGWTQTVVGDYIEVNPGEATGYSHSVTMTASDGFNPPVASDSFILTDAYKLTTKQISNYFEIYIDAELLPVNQHIVSLSDLYLWGVNQLSDPDITSFPDLIIPEEINRKFFDAALNILPDNAPDPAGVRINTTSDPNEHYLVYWNVADYTALTLGVLEVNFQNQNGDQVYAYLPGLPVAPAP